MFGTARAFQLVAVSFPLRRLRLRLQLHVSAPDVFKMASKLDSMSSAAKTSGSSKDETFGDVELTVSAPVFKNASEKDNESSPAKKRKLTKGESSGDVESTVHVAAPVVSKMASKLDNKSSVAKTSGSSKGESFGDVELTVSEPVALKMASKSDNKSSAAKTSGSAKGESSGDVESTSDEEKFTPFFGKCSPFSQHYPCRFTIEGISYNCAEQYMMHQKAVLFKDRKMAEEILSSKNPVEQKRFGRKVKNFDPVVWNKKCEDIVGEANLAKFSQNPDLREKLMATRGTTLVEASPRDRKWGIGLGVNNPKAHCRKKWRGKNLLGQILTSVRDDLDVEEETKSS